MKSPSLKSFLTGYVESLSERSRIEKRGVKYGFDWLIYNLGLSFGWTPMRVPFVRQGGSGLPKAKTEAEFGVDVSFLASEEELFIFVLKDEQLNNTNWTSDGFDIDLRKALYPDLSDPHLSKIKTVKIVLAYNKGDDHTGLQLYDNLVDSSTTTLGSGIHLKHERWNLDVIVQKITESLLTPDLLPQNLSGLLGFLCGLVSRIEFGTPEWEHQVVATWKQFLILALENPVTSQKIYLVTTSLIILKESIPEDKPSSDVAWIDLTEWGMLSLWRVFPKVEEPIRHQIVEIWMHFYVFQLEQYIESVTETFTTQHALVGRRAVTGALSAVNDGYIAFWNLGRLGLLTVAPQEIVDTSKRQGLETVSTLITRNADILVKALHQNPSLLRPLVDAHHVQIFLTWLVLWQSRNLNEIELWLNELQGRLLMRRVDNAGIPFPEGRNRLELVAEYAATNARPPEYVDDSSYLLLVILELCFSLPVERRDGLLKRFHEQIVLGIDSNGEKYVRKSNNQDVSRINLIWWNPAELWDEKVLDGPYNQGISVAVNFEGYENKDKPLHELITEFVRISRKNYPHEIRSDIPRSVLILACMKHGSPLPSEFWRELLFVNQNEGEVKESGLSENNSIRETT